MHVMRKIKFLCEFCDNGFELKFDSDKLEKNKLYICCPYCGRLKSIAIK